jgi:uncharacterized protein YgbK (DUF1537 family)
MYQNAEQVLSQLPMAPDNDLLPIIRQQFVQCEKTVVVFDDDPTGTQTCHDVVVLASWSVELIAEELQKKPSILFILTNSRSLPEPAAVTLTMEIGTNVHKAVGQTKREIVPISRSDSTLRGHFPAEIYALANALRITDATWVLLPAFIEGGRVTIDDVHYITEEGNLIPVADTPFAKDKSFGYTNSNVKEWVQEKTKGKVKASEVISISIDDIRKGGWRHLVSKLSKCRPGQVVIVNAASYRDLEVVTLGLLTAEKRGQKFLYRSSATFVPIRAGLTLGKLYSPAASDFPTSNGSLIVVGSYVPKTTKQLNYLLNQLRHKSIEVSVGEILSGNNRKQDALTIGEEIDSCLARGQDVVVYTTRELQSGSNPDESLKINSAVSNFLVTVVRGLRVQPSFIIAKGGITSSDLASKGLSSQKADILGQAIPGVPVWKLDSKSKFSKILYIVFPGNVGGDSALWEVWYRFKYKV